MKNFYKHLTEFIILLIIIFIAQEYLEADTSIFFECLFALDMYCMVKALVSLIFDKIFKN